MHCTVQLSLTSELIWNLEVHTNFSIWFLKDKTQTELDEIIVLNYQTLANSTASKGKYNKKLPLATIYII